jgi:hypothetical protein
MLTSILQPTRSAGDECRRPRSRAFPTRAVNFSARAWPAALASAPLRSRGFLSSEVRKHRTRRVEDAPEMEQHNSAEADAR